MSNSTPSALPRKPHPDFPLYVHKSDRWAKKVLGKTLFFGKATTDPKGEAAKALWDAKSPYLLKGEAPPPPAADGLTLRELCNKFLDGKRTDLDAEKLSSRTFMGYHRTCETLLSKFGRDRLVTDLKPDDFEKLLKSLVAKHGQTTIGREITMARSVFKYAVESDLIDRAVKFSPRFKAPSKADKRKLRAKRQRDQGKRMFEAEQIRDMLDKAAPQLKAMILLGANCGFGNTDCATLPLSALDLAGGWIDHPRPKTGVERRCPLWPETVEAIRKVLALRKEPKNAEFATLLFLTRLAQPWVRHDVAEVADEDGKLRVIERADDAIAKAFGALTRELGIHRAGLGFYALRHTFETIAGGCRDQVAVDAIMGHVDGSMAGEYRESIDDERLRATVDHVRAWVNFPKAASKKRTAATRSPAQKNLRVIGA